MITQASQGLGIEARRHIQDVFLHCAHAVAITPNDLCCKEHRCSGTNNSFTVIVCRDGITVVLLFGSFGKDHANFIARDSLLLCS
jgi:hypothetical protein